MTEPLPPRARALLDAYREAHDMPEGVRARLASALFDDAAPPRHRFPTRPLLAVAVVAASMLVGIALRPIGDAWQRERAGIDAQAASHALTRDVAEGDAIRMQARSPGAKPSSAATLPEEPLPPSTDVREPEPALTDPPSERPRRTPPLRDTSPVSPTEEAHPTRDVTAVAPEAISSSLAEERLLVELAWSALATRDLTRASDLADTHARTFPRGALAPEREAIEALISCARERATTDSATRFLARYPGSPLAARVRAACRRP